MRRLVQAVVALAFLSGVAGADEIWLKDGRRILTKKPLVQKGALAWITTADGVLLSIPLSEIDLEKTAAERARAAAPAPAPTPGVPKPLTPAEAAKRKSGPKASVVLTDDTIARGIDDETVEKKEGEGRVEVANTSATRTKDGYSFSGSVINAGTGEVSGVSLTVELVAKSGNTFSSAFAQLAKDTLAPGEKSTFTASAPLEGDAASYRYLPHWQVKIPVKSASGAPAAGGSPKAPEPDAAPAPAAAPSPVPTLAPIPRSDVAPPPANVPTGNPANGVFIPGSDAPRPTAKPPGA